MIDLNDYYYFAQVVEKKGFSAASKALDMPKSRLSRHVSRLEERLGVRLLQRSSRQLSITDVGYSFYRHARAILDEVDAAEATVKRQSNTLSGLVRMTCAVDMAHFFLKDILLRFLAEHPKVEIAQQVNNETVDLIETGIDLAIRAHSSPLPDSTLIQRRLAVVPWQLVAGTQYLKKAGVPSTPKELEQHTGLKLGWRSTSDCWSLRHPSGMVVTIPFIPRLRCGDMLTLKQAAIEGLGIVALPSYTCKEEVSSGELQLVLPQWSAGHSQLSLVMPSRRGIMPAVQVLVDYLIEQVPAVLKL